jgi:pyruvate/2-oxoacid:ferredoxin oxidoreductase alpha subunit
MLDLTMEAFALSFAYRNPVIIAADGYLGQMTGRVSLPRQMTEPGLPSWAVCGDADHRQNLISSIYLAETDLERHNEKLNRKYDQIRRHEQRSATHRTDDADVLLIACNTPARMAKGAVEQLRNEGIAAGLFIPLTLWPFPSAALTGILDHVREIVVVEGGPGQLEDEIRLALSHAGIAPPLIRHLRHSGGVLPQVREVVETERSGQEVSA